MKKLALIATCCLFAFHCSETKKTKEGVAFVINDSIKVESEEITSVASQLRNAIQSGNPTEVFEGTNDEKISKLAAREVAVQKILKVLVEQNNVQVDSAKIDTFLQQTMMRMPPTAMSDPAFNKEELRERIENDLRTNELLQKWTVGVDASTAEEVRAYYDQEKERVLGEKMYRVSQIFLSKSDANKQLLEKVSSELNQAADPRETLKKLDASTDQQLVWGSVGWYSDGDLSPLIDSLVRNLELNEISKIAELETGYHIFKKDSLREKMFPEYEMVQQRLHQMLDREKRQKVLTGVFDSLLNATEFTFKDSKWDFTDLEDDSLF